MALAWLGPLDHGLVMASRNDEMTSDEHIFENLKTVGSKVAFWSHRVSTNPSIETGVSDLKLPP
jgi:hypothetical protein